jgi:hypothetical protein
MVLGFDFARLGPSDDFDFTVALTWADELAAVRARFARALGRGGSLSASSLPSSRCADS